MLRIADRAVLAGWFSRMVPDGMALTAAGGYAGFRRGRHVSAAHRDPLRADRRAHRVDAVIDALAALPSQRSAAST